MEELEKIAKTVSSRTKIPVRVKDVHSILSFIPESDNFWQIVSLSKRPIPVVSHVLTELSKIGYIVIREDKIFLNNEKVNNKGEEDVLSNRDNLLARFTEIQKERPTPLQEFDQGYITPESAVARTLFALRNHDVQGSNIIIFGDDDLVSIVLGLTKKINYVLVLEIDKRIVDFINRVAKRENLSVEGVEFDLRNKIPNTLKGRFDVFMSDPPEAYKAFLFFLNKGIYTLKGEGSVGYIGLTLIDSSLQKWQKIQKAILSSGAVITDIIQDFNEYVTWPYHQNTLAARLAPVKVEPNTNWYKSALVRFEFLKKTKKEKNQLIKDTKIYVDNESTTT